MCTLTLWWRRFPDAPVVIAANRDEDPRRPAAQPALWHGEEAEIFAGRDLRAGGTWLGVNRHGLVCGITNRWGQPPDPQRRSRGMVVLDALRCTTAAAAVERLADATDTNPCGLLVADAHTAWRVDVGENVLAFPVAPGGIEVLANWSAETRMPRSERALVLAGAAPSGSFGEALPHIERLLADHQGTEIFGQSICVHGERYATVSSTIVAVGPTGVRWQDTAGNPCDTPWVRRELGAF